MKADIQERADLSYARLGDRGVEALSYALAVNRIVRSICLKHCHLSGVGIKHLLQSLLLRMNAEGAKERLESATVDSDYQEVDLKVIDIRAHALLTKFIACWAFNSKFQVAE